MYEPKHEYDPNVCPNGGRAQDGWHEWEIIAELGNNGTRIKCKHCGLLGWD